MEQIIDTGISFSELKRFLIDIHYWDTPEKRIRHSYILSPGAYRLTAPPHRELQEIAKAAYGAVANLEKHFSELAHQRVLSHEEARFLHVGKSAAHGLFNPGKDPEEKIPSLLKLDLVEKTDGTYAIVEVDTYNPRALGMIALLDETLSLSGRVPAYPIAESIARAVQNEGVGDDWTILVSEKERYYETVYAILARSMSFRGISVHLLREHDVGEDLELLHDGEKVRPILIISESLDRYPRVHEYLLARYPSGELGALYPPKAYLGSKGFLPFLAKQEGMNRFIPATALLVGKYEACVFSKSPTVTEMVAKAVYSSGAKGVVFSDIDAERFSAILAEAAEHHIKAPHWIVQERVEPKLASLPIFEGDSRVMSEFYLRITLYVSATGIAGIKVTGRKEMLVHGASDCVQLPVIFDN